MNENFPSLLLLVVIAFLTPSPLSYHDNESPQHIVSIQYILFLYQSSTFRSIKPPSLIGICISLPIFKFTIFEGENPSLTFTMPKWIFRHNKIPSGQTRAFYIYIYQPLPLQKQQISFPILVQWIPHDTRALRIS